MESLDTIVKKHWMKGTKICTYPKYVEGDLKKVVVAIAAGLSHSVAVTDEGHLYTWGSNEYGQLRSHFKERTKQVRGC